MRPGPHGCGACCLSMALAAEWRLLPVTERLGGGLGSAPSSPQTQTMATAGQPSSSSLTCAPPRTLSGAASPGSGAHLTQDCSCWHRTREVLEDQGALASLQVPAWRPSALQFLAGQSHRQCPALPPPPCPLPQATPPKRSLLRS